MLICVHDTATLAAEITETYCIRELKQATFLSTRTSAGSKPRRYRWRMMAYTTPPAWPSFLTYLYKPLFFRSGDSRQNSLSYQL